MPATTSDPKTAVVTLRPTRAMQRQLTDLIAAGYGSQTAVIITAVDRMYQQERPLVTRSHERQVLIESVAGQMYDGHLDANEMRRINAGEGWTYDVGDDRNWVRHEGKRMTEAEMAEALRLAADWEANGLSA